MIVNYCLYRDAALPPLPDCLYEYVIAANGVFIRAKRPGMSAMFPIAPAMFPIRGLVPAQPSFHLDRRMPEWMLRKMLLRAFDQGHKEILFYARANPWRITIPEQVQSAGGVHPVDPYAGGAETIMEVHSHHGMGAFFSATDNHEEQAGFRLFAVLGRVTSQSPEIRVRVGIYGHFWEIPADWAFELPRFVRDATLPVYAQDFEYVEVEDGA